VIRNTFLVLVLANLGFAAWAAWFAPGPPSAVAPNRASPSQIMLISELEGPALATVEARPAPEPEPVTQEPVAEIGGERCVSVGPFQELAQASAAQGILRESGYAPNQRVVDGEAWIGYWVYLPEIPTRDAANDILTQLRDNDIADAYIIPGGEESQTISLGVFSEINRAASIRERVRALGFEPTVADRSRAATLYWIDVVASGNQPIDLDALQPPGRINRLEQRACPATG